MSSPGDLDFVTAPASRLAIEFLCPGCGDHPYLDYSEVPLRLRRLRWTPVEAGLATYHKPLALPWPTRIEPEAPGPGYAKAGRVSVPR